MNCQSAKDLMPGHLDGLLQPDEEKALHAHLESCPACRAELADFRRVLDAIDKTPADEPSPALERKFQAMLRDEIRAERNKKSSSLASRFSQFWASLASRPLLQVGYSCCLLLAGLFLGSHFLAPKPTPVEDSETRRELAALRSKIDSMGQLVAYSIEKQDSDVARLHKVSNTRNEADLNSKELDSLVAALAFDPSTNVRLAAIEALYPHADKRIVRDCVLSSLPRERSLLVQLAMIDFLGSIRDPRASEALQALARDTSADQRAKDAARRVLSTQI